MTGVVTKIQKKSSKPHKSYGFVADLNDNEYWFSLSEVTDELNVGDAVFFMGERNERGNVAVHVRSLS